MDENKLSTFSFLRSEAVFIAILTTGAYLIAFSFEAGYLNKFNIPLYLIKINIELILFFIIILSSSLFLLLFLANFIAMIFPEHAALQEKTIRIIIMLLLPLWNLIIYGLRKQDVWLYLIIFIIMIFLEILWPLLVYRNIKSIKDKFIADEIAEARVREKGILGRLHLAIGSLISNLIYILILGAILAHSAGGANAVTQKEYYLLGDNSNIAVLRIYSDMVIGVPIDFKNKLVENKVIIQKIGERDKVELVPSKVGPLNF